MNGTAIHHLEEDKIPDTLTKKEKVAHLNNGTISAVKPRSQLNGKHGGTSEVTQLERDEKWSERRSFDDIFHDDYLFETLLDYFTFEEIFTVFHQLNSKYAKLVDEANYLLLRKLTDKLHITSSYLVTDLPAREKIMEVYKQTVIAVREERTQNLKPTAFYTDSGLVGTNMWYSFHNIFDVNNTNMYGGYVFSSNSGTNNHVQAYLCQAGTGVDNNFCSKMKKDFEETPGSKEIRVPYQKYLDDGSIPTFKVPKVFEINCRNQGYCYYADNIVLCFSESEVDNKKFKDSTKFFEKFKSVNDVKESGIPILNIDDTTKGFTAIEFDLSQKKKILELLEIKEFVSVPLVYMFIDKNQLYGKAPSYEIKQNIAAKYMSMKLLC